MAHVRLSLALGDKDGGGARARLFASSVHQLIEARGPVVPPTCLVSGVVGIIAGVRRLRSDLVKVHTAHTTAARATLADLVVVAGCQGLDQVGNFALPIMAARVGHRRV